MVKQHVLLSKTLVFSIIICFMLLVPSAFAITKERINHQPEAPTIEGPVLIHTPGPHEYTFKAIDPDGDDVSYEIDWGDGGISEWTDWYPSGEKITQSHIYDYIGAFEVRARAKDIYGAIGDWGYLKLLYSESTQESSSELSNLNIENDVPLSISVMNNGSLSGYVNDTSGNPIEGALVRVYFHETYEEDYSDSTGYYHVTNIPICYCLKNATCSKGGIKQNGCY